MQLLSPYDLNGTLSHGHRQLFDSRLLLNGAHTLTTEVLRLERHGRAPHRFVQRQQRRADGDSAAPGQHQRNAQQPVVLNGQTLTGSVAIFVAPTTSVKTVEFWLDKTNLTVSPVRPIRRLRSTSMAPPAMGRQRCSTLAP